MAFFRMPRHLQGPQDLRQHRKKGHDRSGEVVDPEDGRKPVRVERHQQVERREVQAQGKEDHARRTQALHPQGECGVAACVLSHRRAVEEGRHRTPDQEVDGEADHEEGRVEKARLPRKQGVVGHGSGVGPVVEMVHAENHRGWREPPSATHWPRSLRPPAAPPHSSPALVQCSRRTKNRPPSEMLRKNAKLTR